LVYRARYNTPPGSPSPEGANTLAKYVYDGASGRIVKVTYSGGSPTETRHYYLSSAWRVLEERVGTSMSPEGQG
jgi:hypothetical protein